MSGLFDMDLEYRPRRSGMSNGDRLPRCLGPILSGARPAPEPRAQMASLCGCNAFAYGSVRCEYVPYSCERGKWNRGSSGRQYNGDAGIAYGCEKDLADESVAPADADRSPLGALLDHGVHAETSHTQLCGLMWHPSSTAHPRGCESQPLALEIGVIGRDNPQFLAKSWQGGFVGIQQGRLNG